MELLSTIMTFAIKRNTWYHIYKNNNVEYCARKGRDGKRCEWENNSTNPSYNDRKFYTMIILIKILHIINLYFAKS